MYGGWLVATGADGVTVRTAVDNGVLTYGSVEQQRHADPAGEPGRVRVRLAVQLTAPMVDARFTALVSAGHGTALRATARDRAANTVDQTAVDAYGLR